MRASRVLRLGWISLTLGASTAWGQWAPPFDPDFAPQKAASAPPPAPEELDVPVVLPATGPFLLIDRPDPSRLFERPAEPAAPHEFSEFEMSLKPFEYSHERWVKARENIEEGKAPKEGALEFYVERPAEEFPAGAPKPPPPEVEMPAYGTSLSITGRKVINFQFSEKRFLHPQKTTSRPSSTNLFEINQQLQLRMQGKVGPKITVNVDYDDTKENKQDISVVYQGDSNEIVQNVSFGDIDLSLPATEFVSYNKQLFGIRADIKYKGFKSSFIGSRTKGTTKFKQFFGNTQFVTTDILDTGYLRSQYYDLTFSSASRLPLRSASERVFLAKQVPGPPNVNDVILTVDDLAVKTSSFTGRFQQLQPGSDYTIDYAKGLLTFRNRLESQHIVAVDFIDATGNSITIQSTTSIAGGTGLLKLVKTAADIPIAVSSETGHNRELKTFYSIGQTQIVRDNGRGNFILKVLDKDRKEVGPDLLPIQKYPDTISVDFENGIFQLQAPFSVTNASPSTPHPEIYAATPISKRLFQVEYNYRFKTFFLEPSIVAQSEVVVLDGVKLTRNVDYFIDYEAGFLTFFNENRIRPESSITIAFEVAPFAAIANESLLGTRVSYEWKKVAMGSTLLYQSGTKSPTIPQVSELSRSLLTYEFDTQLKQIQLLPKLLFSFSGELAQSRQNLNLNAFALIDNMEGVKLEDSATVVSSAWRVASNPGGVPSDPTKVEVFSEDVKVLDINPRAETEGSETQKVLGFKYDFNSPGTQEVSIVYPFSFAGTDFSQKNILEVVMLGDNSLNDLNFHLGGIAEDSDSDVVLDTEDANNDGLLQSDEDLGYLYNPAGKASARFGSTNGQIDSEDLNRNGRLDAADFTGDDYGYAGSAVTGNDILFNATDSTNHNFVNFGTDKWRTFQIQLNISSATSSRWTAIKHLRISMRKRGAGATSGVIKFARLAVVGNTWQRGQAGDTSRGQGSIASERLLVTPVNSVDNPTYVPIFNAGGDASQAFKDLYGELNNLQRQSGSKNISEQALQLEFTDLIAGAAVYTKRLFTRAIDTSQHRYFNLLLYANADANNVNVTGNKVFSLRAGNDLNFLEIQVPLDYIGWKKVVIEQTDQNGDSIGDGWRAVTPGVVIISSGGANLQQISHLMATVRSTGVNAGETTRGRLFLNEIYLSEPLIRVGTAVKMESNFEIPGWATFGAKHRRVDRNFQTPTSVVSNQDNRQDSGYLNFSRLSFFPMTFNVSRTVTDTPSTAKTGDLSNIINLLQQGKVVSWSGSASGNFNYGSLPRLSAGYTKSRVDYKLLTRLDQNDSYNGSLSYAVPLNLFVLPKTIDANYTYARHLLTYDRLDVKRLPGNPETDELNQNYGLRMTFVPWFGSSFNPTYTLSRAGEKRTDFSVGPIEKVQKYPKSLNQTVGFSSNWRILRWLNPQANYTVNTIENNVLTVSTFVVGGSTHVFDVGQIKTINRNANGSVSLPFVIGDIFPNFRLTRSMNIAAGYQIQDGDVWNNVEDRLRTETKLWIRSPLRPRSPVSQRSNQTLRDTYNSTQRWSPLEAFNIPGRLAPFRTLNLSNNYVQSIQRTDVTGTLTKTITTTFPDAVASMSQLERLLYLERWLQSMQINFKYSANRTLVVGQTQDDDESFGTDLRSIIFKKFDTLVSYNNRTSDKRDIKLMQLTQTTSHEDSTVQVTFDYSKFRFTPKVDYSKDRTKLGTGVVTQDLTAVTPSLLMRADLALPKGLKLPGSKKVLLFTNRIIWTTTTSLAIRSSPVTVADNSKLFSLNTSGDYEIAKNLRMTLNGAVSRLWHKHLKEEEFVSYLFGSTLTFQF